MRDGRRKRLGLQEGTEGTVGDTYLDRILTDAEAAGNPYTIAADTDVNFDTRDFRNIADTYNYYYGGGFDTAQDDATPPSSGDGGSSDGGTGGGTTPTTPGTNTPEEQRLIDEGIGLQIGPGQPVFAPGEAPVTQEEIDAFNQIPVSTDYDVPDSTYDEAGLDLNPGGSTYDEAGIQGYQPTYASTGDQSLLDLAGGEAGGPDGVGIIDGVNMVKQPQTLDVTEAIEPQAVKTILGPDGITYDAVTGNPIYEDLDAQAAATNVVTEQDLADNTGLLQKLGLPADFDLKQAAIEAGINLVAGVPITLIARGLEAVLPDRDPRQNALEEMYDVKNGTIQSGLMQGYNPVSGNPFNPTYGLQDAYQKRIDTINKTLGKMTLEQYQNTDLVQRKKDLEEAMAKEKTMLDQLQYGDPEKIAAGIQTADDDSGSEMLDTTSKDDIFGFKDLDDQVVYSDYQDIGETSDSYNYPDRKQLVDSGTITPLEDDFESLVDQGDIPKQVESTTMSDISLAEMPFEEFLDLANNSDFNKGFDQRRLDLVESRNRGQEYLDDLEEIGKGDDYIGYTEQEKADIAAGRKEPQLGELVDFAIDTTIGPSDQSIINKGGGDDISTGGLDRNRGQQVDRGSSGAGDNEPVSTTTGPPSTGFQPQSTYDAELEDDRDVGGGGNDGGGGGSPKIVCTMMNESYGFGSFRNKIWMKFHKDLSPEYQKGYHKLFLPLVKIAKTNKVVKKVLEHIAVHSTIDMRQATRGKTHLLGRVYRKILLPLCYWVGKNAKR